jgi:hypothetical protein
LTAEEAQTGGSLIFFCSKNYVWVASEPFGDGLQVKWNRVTNELVDGRTEFLTAITVSGDENHTVYVGSNLGNLWRLDGPHDLATFNATEDVHKLNTNFVSFIDLNMTGRSISDLAVDPLNSNRLIVTFSGFGGNLGAPSFVWATDSARDDNPGFGSLSDMSGALHTQLFHSAEFVVEDGKSVLLLGGQKGLYTVRDIAVESYLNGTVPAEYHWPTYTSPTWTTEFAETFGEIPVYDIFVRNYTTTIQEDALTREIVIDGETRTVARDGLVIAEDQTIYLATHGRGFWSSTSVASGRQGSPVEPIQIEEAAIRLFPNPTNDFTNIEVDLTEQAQVQVRMFSLDGRLVAQQFNSHAAGRHASRISVSDLAPGTYVVQVEILGDTQQLSETFKSVIIK